MNGALQRFLNNGCVSSLPITLLQQVAFLLTAKLLVSLQLVHAVATLLTLRVLHKPTQHCLAHGVYRDAAERHAARTQTHYKLIRRHQSTASLLKTKVRVLTGN